MTMHSPCSEGKMSISCHLCLCIVSLDIPVSGFMDSKAECGQEGVPSWASIGNQLFSGK